MSNHTTNHFSRRRFLQGMAAAAGGAAMHSLPGGLGQRAWASGKPETTEAKLGFIALTDAAPLFIAKEKGFFADHGMTDVQVLKQSSWGTVRDNLVLGSGRGGIDGSHILTPMPYLMTAGVEDRVGMYVLARLNLAGQCISVANEYSDLKVGLDTTDFAKALRDKRDAGEEVRAAMTFPGGTHDLWIRYWMAAGGIDPERDIDTIVVPPAQMVANMRVGSMDAFCVCEPWNQQLVNHGLGYTANTTGELWHNHPEKAFGMRQDYVDENPNATRALLMAIMEAQMYCADPDNVEEVAEICARRRYVHAPYDDIIDRMRGDFDYGNGRVVENHPDRMRYWSDQASYPFKSHDLWFVVEDQRWGYLPMDLDRQALVDHVNREDLWREAAAELGVDSAAIPDSTSRGKEEFFDGKVFDPEDPDAYLDSLDIKYTS
ncbi:CmpA/NrtA family ABC transporter substrate-binding protein [Aquisalimonas asiatica]|uniref:Nitrate/nitrite transport system substrate-binding protein n=1 Tax=Aquisalimonas asiatica TaxID=406100 RepID=A0A1H8TH73_9GAMM|nr:CmpA/NrtA family ABC transporter substrate-binding protein [Aquisalimonas asiatica]SEO90272.1 nitrate/nitrite transport system substrate-binding protein [Aquisalimonas asiatica]